jgi:hypothetical protein
VGAAYKGLRRSVDATALRAAHHPGEITFVHQLAPHASNCPAP